MSGFFWFLAGLVFVVAVVCLVASFIGARELQDGFDLEEKGRDATRQRDRLAADYYAARGHRPDDERNAHPTAAQWAGAAAAPPPTWEEVQQAARDALDARMRDWPEYKWRHGPTVTTEPGWPAFPDPDVTRPGYNNPDLQRLLRKAPITDPEAKA